MIQMMELKLKSKVMKINLIKISRKRVSLVLFKPINSGQRLIIIRDCVLKRVPKDIRRYKAYMNRIIDFNEYIFLY